MVTQCQGGTDAENFRNLAKQPRDCSPMSPNWRLSHSFLMPSEALLLPAIKRGVKTTQESSHCTKEVGVLEF